MDAFNEDALTGDANANWRWSIRLQRQPGLYCDARAYNLGVEASINLLQAQVCQQNSAESKLCSFIRAQASEVDCTVECKVAESPTLLHGSRSHEL
jgi:hypothetical protein